MPEIPDVDLSYDEVKDLPDDHAHRRLFEAIELVGDLMAGDAPEGFVPRRVSVIVAGGKDDEQHGITRMVMTAAKDEDYSDIEMQVRVAQDMVSELECIIERTGLPIQIVPIVVLPKDPLAGDIPKTG